MRFMSKHDHLCVYEVPSASDIFSSRHQIRKLYLQITPEYRPMEAWHPDNLDNVDNIRHKGPYAGISESKLKYLLHFQATGVSEYVWTKTAKVLADLRSLENLTLDVDQAYCTEGCCRNCQRIVESFKVINEQRSMDRGPLVKIHIVGAEDLEDERKLMTGLGGVLEEDSSYGCSDCDVPDEHYKHGHAEDAGNDSGTDQTDSDYSHNDSDDDGEDDNTTDGEDYDNEDHPAFNENLYVEYGPEDEDVIASRKRYVCARFDNIDNEGNELPNTSLSPLAQKHNPADRRLMTIGYIFFPAPHLYPFGDLAWRQKLGLSLLRISERRFAQQMIYASHPYYLVDHPIHESFTDPRSQHEAPCCLYKRLHQRKLSDCNDHQGDCWFDMLKANLKEGCVDKFLTEFSEWRHDRCWDTGTARKEQALALEKADYRW